MKSFSILNSTFAHIPQVGIYVESTGQLEIKDNIFMKVLEKQSIGWRFTIVFRFTRCQ